MKGVSFLMVAFVLPAWAQTPPTPATTAVPAAGGGTFATLDADRDGRVSSTEADRDAGFSAAFASMDKNADGFVTADEYKARAKANAQPETRR